MARSRCNRKSFRRCVPHRRIDDMRRPRGERETLYLGCASCHGPGCDVDTIEPDPMNTIRRENCVSSEFMNANTRPLIRLWRSQFLNAIWLENHGSLITSSQFAVRHSVFLRFFPEFSFNKFFQTQSKITKSRELFFLTIFIAPRQLVFRSETHRFVHFWNKSAIGRLSFTIERQYPVFITARQRGE